jgi:hypothetical protein
MLGDENTGDTFISQEDNNSNDIFGANGIELQTEDDGDFIPVSFNNDFNANEAVEKTENFQEQKIDETKKENSNEEFRFSDEDIDKENFENKEKENDDDEEKLIARLKEKGFDVSKKETVDLSKVQQEDLKRIDSFLSEANTFLKQNDEVIVREKLKSDLARTYQAAGKGNMIGSEEFDIDLEVEYTEYEDSSTLRKLFADTVRRDLKDLVTENENKKNTIISDKEKSEKEKITGNRLKVQDSLKEIMKSGILGLQVDSERAQKIYDKVRSGEFSKTINSDPSLVAEFATYYEYREELIGKFGGPTYGEGVKAAVDAIAGDNKNATKSPLQNAMNIDSSKGQGGLKSGRSAWNMPVVKEEDMKDRRTAGLVKEYL